MADFWTQVAPQLDSQTQILCLVVFNGKLYGGTGVDGRLFEWDDVSAWVEVAPQLDSQIAIHSLVEFNSTLYGGTANDGRLFEWNGVHAWVEVAGTLNTQLEVRALRVFNNKLYGGTGRGGNGGRLFQWNETNAWIEVAPRLNSQDLIWDLAEFNSTLYGATNPGGRLFEWNGTNAWTQVAPQLNSQTDIFSLAVFNGKLYGGTGLTGRLFEWNGTNAWVQVAPQLDSQTRIYALALFNGKLYGGTNGGGRLFQWNETNAWIEVAAQLSSQADIFSLVVFNKRLYGGTGQGGRLFRWSGIARARIMGGGNFNAKRQPRHLPPSTAPELLLHNTTEEDSDGGRESVLRYKGEQSGGELSTLAMIRGSHDGAADDEKGQIEVLVNDTNDGDSPTNQMTISSVDVTLERGVLALPETTTPTPVADEGRVYAKSDNRFYFQDGAGQEHRIVTSDYAGILVDDNEVEMEILLQHAYEPVLIFGAGTVSGVNMPEIISNGDFSNNNITIGASADYDVNIHINAESAGTNKTLEADVFMIAASGENITAGGITQANPGVVNITGHSFNDGDRVKISGVSGMTEVNGQIYTVAGAGANDFQLNDDNGGNINTSGYVAYTSGGTVFLATCIDTAHAHRQFGAGAGDVGSFSGGGIAALIGGDTLELHMKNISDTNNMTSESIQFSIIRL